MTNEADSTFRINVTYISRSKMNYDHISRGKKAFHKIQYPFILKHLSKLGIEKTINVVNNYYKELYS